jgi:cell division protein ZapA (FtsZ GTPase activity inhibitor)
MKTLTFLTTIFLMSCIYTLVNEKQDLKEEIKDLDETILSKDSLINQIQESNRKYIDAALGNKK